MEYNTEQLQAMPAGQRLDLLQAELDGILEQLRTHVPLEGASPAGVDRRELDGLADALRGLDEQLREVQGARAELAELNKRVNTLGRHLVGIAQQVGYTFPQRDQDTATGQTPAQRPRGNG